MRFTGERFLPSEQGKIRLEHYHRYVTIFDVVAQKDVLDVACGEGYGSSIMADVARSVVGVDISDEAVRHASTSYKKENLRFIQGSATNLDFADASFDVVVSFETIEHLLEQEKMLSEIRRVLRPDGFLVISSPNRPVYSEESGEHNEYHVKELDFNEFDELLKKQFPAVQYFGQRMLMGSVIQSIDGGQGYFRAWHDDGETLKHNTAPLSEPVYFLAVCGTGVDDLPELETSILYPSKLDLLKHYVGFAKWAQTLDLVVAERDEQIVALSQAATERDRQSGFGFSEALAERDRQIANLVQELAQRTEWASRLDSELKEERARLLQITKSNSWRVTLPVREVRRWVSDPAPQAKRYARGALQLSKQVYQSLPLSYQTRAVHRNLLAKYFSKVLLASGSHAATIPGMAQPLIKQTMPEQFANPEDFVKTFELPLSKTPLVSVIIPVYGQIAYTLRCLASIALNSTQIAFEIIVVDDCSPDNSVEILGQVRGIRLLCNEKNQGFIRSCNAGARAAQGDYLYFLNNDTEVTPGWIDELVRTFCEFPGTGLAGSKLVYPDGRLQEAGGIIWQDGSAWNFGRFQDQLLPAYNYAREVDYCSGASIMVPKTLFDELGGFDEHYLPAYCEDSDLALKIRDRGFRVIYQPLSVVIHYEGITSGTDTGRGAKAYQIENSKKLFVRWKSHLQSHQMNGVDVDGAKDRTAKRRVLVLEHCTPTPDQDAGSVSVFNILLLLREMDYQVTFIPEDNFLYIPDYTSRLQRIGVEVLYAPYCTSVKQHLLESGARYDLAFLFRPVVVERHLADVRKFCPQAKVLFYTHDLHHLRMQREAALLGSLVKQKAAEEMKQREFAAIRAVDASIVVSTIEFELLHQELPDDKIHVLPLILDIPGTDKKFAGRHDIVFVGGYEHTPNIDAVEYFVNEVMPFLRPLLPGVRFFAVGSKPTAAIHALAREDVIISGFVEHLTPFLDRMRIAVAPLRYGAGIKGKIGTAMAAGLPTVATVLAAEGMSLTQGENIIVADGAEAFAGAVAALYQNESLWNHLSDMGISFAERTWGMVAAGNNLNAVLADIDLPYSTIDVSKEYLMLRQRGNSQS